MKRFYFSKLITLKNFRVACIVPLLVLASTVGYSQTANIAGGGNSITACPGSANVLVYSFSLAETVANTNIDGFHFTTTAGATTTTSIYYVYMVPSTGNTLTALPANAFLFGAAANTGPGLQTITTMVNDYYVLSSGTTYYFYITANLLNTATAGATITVTPPTTSNFLYYSATATAGTNTATNGTGTVATAATCGCTQYYSYNGNYTTTGGTVQTYAVPAGCTQLSVQVAGASGGVGGYYNSESWGGNGGVTNSTLNVTPSTNLYVYAGNVGASCIYTGLSNSGYGGSNSGGGAQGGNGSYYEGGGGGGETDIRTSNTGDLTTRCVMGGGGGGGSAPFTATTNQNTGGNGGNGSGSGGGLGLYNTAWSTVEDGNQGAFTCCATAGSSGTNGALGAGGNCFTSNDGGGGGGGYYGAGGASLGGACGGSSFAQNVAGVTVSGTNYSDGANLGAGYVIITPMAPVAYAVTGGGPTCIGSGGAHVGLSNSLLGVNYQLQLGGVNTGAPMTGTGSAIDFGPQSAIGVYTVFAYYTGYTTCTFNQTGSATTFSGGLAPTITGTQSVCSFAVTNLSATPTGGTWVSSNIAQATVGSSSGAVTGAVPGTSSITYTTTGGCTVSAAVTVNAGPAPITGTPVVCAGGGTVSLGEASSGGTWSSSLAAIAAISSAGVLTGSNQGTATINYTFSSTGCLSSVIATVNPLPNPYAVIAFSPSGSSSAYCAGSTSTIHIELGSSNVGVSYQLFDATTAGVTALPAIISPANGLLDFGVQSNVGTYTAIATNPLSINPVVQCSINMLSSASISITPLPSVLPVTVSSNGLYCASGSGVSISVNGATIVGDTYKLYNSGSPVASAAGALTSITFPGLYPTGSYTVIASDATANHCSSTMNGGTPVNVTAEPLPDPQAITVQNGGFYCAGAEGVHVGLSFSNSGIMYSLYANSVFVDSVAGSNAGLDFGLQTTPGTYTVVATNATSRCTSNMTGSIIVTVNNAPTPYALSGGGNFCPGGIGVPLGVTGSDAGAAYQLYNGIVPVGGTVTGTGSGFNFGTSFSTAGTYYVTGTSATGCKDTMPGYLTITPNVLPTVYPVTGGGPYCQGGTGVNISLGGGDFGVTYQLYNGSTEVGDSITGLGSPITFYNIIPGGTYTIVANNGSCTANMLGSATIIVNALPTVHSVTGTGGYCSNLTGRHVGLDFSDVGISYQLYNVGGPYLSPVMGSGSGLDFGLVPAGSYTVVGTNSLTMCSSNMLGTAFVNINSLPNQYSVTPGTGDYCAGGIGVQLGLSGSDAGVNYQLYLGASATGSPVAGGAEGGSIIFGYDTAAGTYTVIATNTSTTCTNSMTGNAVITIDPLPVIYTLSAPAGNQYCSGGAGVPLTLSGSATGISYQLNNSGAPADTLVSGTGSSIDFGMQTTAGPYTVVATNAATTCTSNMAGSPIINILPLPIVHNVTGGGNYCTGGTGAAVGLDSSDAGIQYQLLINGLPAGGTTPGSGAALNFGLRTPVGAYTIVASSPVTTCTVDMAGSVSINTIALPNLHSVAGGGPYCAGTTAPSIDLISSDEGVTYNLYLGSTLITSMSGGAPIDFGPQPAAGTYTVVAVGSTTPACSQVMSGDAIVTINTVNAYTVIGGGSYCQGGTGVHIGQSSSASGVSYQLVNGGTTNVGSPVMGTGGPIDFGLDTMAGTYTVVGTNTTTECTGNMAGSATITINSLPAPYNVTGGSTVCAGGTVSVGLNGSSEGVNYQLYYGSTPVGSLVSGTGLLLSLGTVSDSGVYTAVGINATTGCMGSMAGNAVAIVKPLPTAYAVTAENYGNYCAGDTGVHVGLLNSTVGVTYVLHGGSATAPISVTMTGTGSALDFGLETVAGSYIVTGSQTDVTPACSNTMAGSANVYIIPLPTVHNVTGTGGYCPGGAGVDVGLDGSQAGIYYQLYDASGPVGGSIYGTGVALNFGIQPAGVYTVVGNSEVIAMGYVTTCPNPMFGSAVVSIDTLLLPSVTLKAYPGNGVGVWHIDSMKVFVTNGGSNPTFQWVVNDNIIPGATSATFSDYAFFNGDSVSCMVTASGPCGGLTKNESIVLSLHNVGVTQVTAAGSDVKLVPNPNNGTFTVKGTLGTTADEEVNVEVTNMLGQVVYSNKVMTQGGNIEARVELASSLANGMYIMTLHSGTQNNVIHFVIEQ